jgi:hypothetical protein
MRVRHRLAPIRHRERGIDLLRLAERFRGRRILEVVQQRQASQERRLRLRLSGIRERDVADGARLRNRGNGNQENE